jgi:hypothetical protein
MIYPQQFTVMLIYSIANYQQASVTLALLVTLCSAVSEAQAVGGRGGGDNVSFK